MTTKQEIYKAATWVLTIGTIIIILSILMIVQGCAPWPTTPRPCTVTQTDTGVIITCADGTTATLLNGTNGSPGLNGVNSNSTIYPVQLCPGFTPSYPNVFPESALCIDNSLWGVYSANGGFGLILPPGQYSSSGLNASCNITVGVNCEVTVN